jgi:hypothetical protein
MNREWNVKIQNAISWFEMVHNWLWPATKYCWNTADVQLTVACDVWLNLRSKWYSIPYGTGVNEDVIEANKKVLVFFLFCDF